MPQTLFISYSHKDEKHKDYVIGQLGVAEQQGLLRTWDDRRIGCGGDWRGEIEAALAEAKVAVLLVSHHFLTSEFILNEEVSIILRRRDQEGVVVYPIILRACDWESVDWLKAMNLRPKDGKPLTRFTLDRRDEVMAGISKEIRGLLEDGTAVVPELVSPSPVDDEIDRLAARTEALSAELGTTRDALNGMFEVLAEQNVPVEQLESRLRAIAERHVELTQRLRVLSNDAPEVAALRQQATEALEEGDYDLADDLLEQAEEVDDEALREQQDALDRRKLSKARTRSERGELERARLNYRRAAAHFAEAARLVPASEDVVRFDYLMRQGSVLYDQGNEFGDNPALVQAINLYRVILNDYARDCRPLQWATARNDLGNALATLGERENGKERLEEAVDAYRAALEERTRKHVPLDWAITQNNLSNTLRILGERESGIETLEAAVDASHAALEERSRERMPLDWAITQNNLGIALAILGARQSDTTSLEAAVDAFHSALEEYTRERVPLFWAATQNNLGATLWKLGQNESGTASLEAAVDAYRAALEERIRGRVPLDWAATQNNLGIALATLSARESDTTNLEAAVEAYRAALKEYTRERVPLQWAITQENIGLAYCSLAEKSRDQATLLQGIEAIRAALEIFEEGQVAFNIEEAKRNLADAEVLLVELKGESLSS